MLRNCCFIILTLLCTGLFAQLPVKQFAAQRTTGVFKIDGELNEATWKTAISATGFVEFRPAFNMPENEGNKTVVYILYDNNAIYVGGYCYERTADSISKELVGRDVVGVNDFVGVIFDTYMTGSMAMDFM